MSERAKRAALYLLLASVPVPTALAQSGGGYDLHWNVPAAGGGYMSGANGYALKGTLTQADANPAGTLAGNGGYAVRGGFWHGQTDRIFANGFEATP